SGRNKLFDKIRGCGANEVHVVAGPALVELRVDARGPTTFSQLLPEGAPPHLGMRKCFSFYPVPFSYHTEPESSKRRMRTTSRPCSSPGIAPRWAGSCPVAPIFRGCGDGQPSTSPRFARAQAGAPKTVLQGRLSVAFWALPGGVDA